MEWRYVYTREEIWNDRKDLLDASASGKTFRNPLLVSPECVNFLNLYQVKCADGIMTPVWPQDFKKHTSGVPHKDNEMGENRNRGGNVWRGERSTNISSTTPQNQSTDFQKFAEQAWQPQVLNQYNARIKDLRSIFNKWTPRNSDVMVGEFKTWWKNANDFGYWKPFFVIFEWFRKLQQERVAQPVWYENVFKAFLDLSWPIQPQERQVNQRIKSNLYDGVNSLPRDWIQYWSSFQREHQSIATISWKKWITTAVELNLRNWFEKYVINENSTEEETIEIIPSTVICSFVSTLWTMGILPVRFLPWCMLVLPLECKNEEVAWKWRSQIWEAIDANIHETQLKTHSEYKDCWRRWKNGFMDHGREVLTPDIDNWNLRLRYKWSILCPDWSIEITQEDVDKKRKVVDEIVQEIIVEETYDSGIWESDILTEQDYSNIRSLTTEWKEMGKQGWMDSYFPEWYMEDGNHENKMIWWDSFFFSASQLFDMKNIWENQDWNNWIRWILDCSTDYRIWLSNMIEQMKNNPPEWTIECPLYNNIIDGMRQFI